MRERFYRFMAGRNGSDLFSRFLSFAAVAFMLLSLIFRGTAGTVMWYIALLLLIYDYFRIFSRNLPRRRAENAKYCQYRGQLIDGFRDWRERRHQSRDYKFFRCPSCSVMLRVPRGKGHIRVTCRKCGTSFERKT